MNRKVAVSCAVFAVLGAAGVGMLRAQGMNRSAASAKTYVIFIAEKGKPLTTPVRERARGAERRGIPFE